MKSKELLLLLTLFIVLAPGSVLPQSATAIVAGRLTGLPNANVASFQVVLVSDGGRCAVLQTGTREVLMPRRFIHRRWSGHCSPWSPLFGKWPYNRVLFLVRSAALLR